jgi:hypothetical protein
VYFEQLGAGGGVGVGVGVGVGGLGVGGGLGSGGQFTSQVDLSYPQSHIDWLFIK